MANAQISPPSILANPSHINPAALHEQQAAVSKVSDQAQKTIKKASTDTVTISKTAVRMAR